jgi:hypothetical protein
MMGFRKFTIFIMLFALTACFQAAQTPRQLNQVDGVNSGDQGDGDGNGITGTDGSVNGDGDVTIAKVEIRHLIEPKIDNNNDSDAGDYKRKLTIPKNYNNLLYVAGINISSLSDRSIKVRFKFGVDSLPLEIPATVSTAAGLTPQTDVEVLVMDLRGKPFEDIQLLYDLYDYNEYDFDSSGTNPSALTEPVNHNRDDKLFCRGLALKDDSTFSGSLVDGCSGDSDVCKFAYAKVVDKGLVAQAVGALPDLPITPSEPNIQSGSSGYYNDTNSIKLSRCLADNPLLSAVSHTFDLTPTTFLTYGDTAVIDTDTYIYQGPYRAINTASWAIEGDAVKGQYGLYSGMLLDSVNVGVIDEDELSSGYGSKLFPLYTKFSLINGTEYLGGALPDSEKTLWSMNSNGDSEWMDGCNERSTSVHEITGEHIGSCNITATIEIIATDDEGVETVVDISDEVKLQLVKPATLNTTGDNVLLSSFSQCSSSSQCGADECCINKHCWGKSIVKQCIEDLPSYGNQQTGELCNSDYQCSSLCCNKIDGRCAPHDTISENPSYCSKPAQQSCVAKEWCQKHPVTTCAIVDTGPDPLGGNTCALRCVTAEVYGDCVSPDGLAQGVCIPPSQPDSPVFNPSDPNRCDDMITFNELVECANNPDVDCSI